jgi:type IV secretion system protein VirB9
MRSHPAPDPPFPVAPASEPPVSVPKAAPVLLTASASRTVAYRDTDVVPIATRVRFSTLILLPKTERILDFTTGDKDFWAISGNENVAYVKPAKEHSQTNLNLITASGNVYSFVLTETSGHPETQPDLKVFVEAAEPKMAEAASAPPRFVAVSQIEDYRQQVQIAKEETREAKQAAQSTIDRSIEKFRGGYPTNLKFVYRIEREKRPFLVTAMYHDDRFTYIQARPQETPVVYELKDGKPNLINFDYRDGTYVVSKILDSGYLSVGKEKLSFKREE